MPEVNAVKYFLFNGVKVRNSQNMRAKLHAQKGNSPDRRLRSLNLG